MSQYCDSSGFMNAVYQLLHIRVANAARDSITKDVDIATVKRELEAGNHQKRMSGECLADPSIVFHAAIVENLRVITHSHEAHTGLPQCLGQPVEGFFAV